VLWLLAIAGMGQEGRLSPNVAAMPPWKYLIVLVIYSVVLAGPAAAILGILALRILRAQWRQNVPFAAILFESAILGILAGVVCLLLVPTLLSFFGPQTERGVGLTAFLRLSNPYSLAAMVTGLTFGIAVGYIATHYE
jgi:hypothetical protein